MIRADRDKISRVLINLVHNGIKFTPPGGRVQVAASGDGEWVTLAVRDSGPGIPPEGVAPGVRAILHHQAAGSGDRSGLGLSVTWGIVREFGGWIEVSRAPGAGARFDVFLPRQLDKDG